MTLTNLFLFAVPAALVALKLTALALAVVWSVRSTFETRDLHPSTGLATRQLPMPVQATNE